MRNRKVAAVGAALLTAAAMQLVPGPRGLVAMPRADATTDPAALIGQLNQAFAAFREANDARIKALETGRADVVTNDKVDRINAEITKLQGSIDELTAKAAAALVGGSGDQSALTAEMRAYSAAFNTYFRYGDEPQGGLSAMAVKASMQTQSNPDGGYLVAPEMEKTIDRVLATVSAVRSMARVLTISSGIYKKPVSIGGTAAGWVGETGGRPETATGQLSELAFPAMELYAMPAATLALLDDAVVDIAQWLADEVTIVFAEQEGAAFVSGDGANRPKGILAYDAVADANYAWGKIGYVKTGAAADFAAAPNAGDALVDLVYSLKAGYRQNGRFLMNRKVQAAIRKMKNADGDYLWQPNVQAGQPATLLGYPVADDDNMPNVGANAFPVAFADWTRAYLIVDRKGVRILRDPYSKKPYVLFYTTKRVGGGVQNFEAIKLLKCEA